MNNVQDTIRRLIMLSEMEKEKDRRGGKYYDWLEGKIIPSTIEEADKVELARLYQMDTTAKEQITSNYLDLVQLGYSLQEIIDCLIEHIDLHKEMLEICNDNIELVSQEYENRGGDDYEF